MDPQAATIRSVVLTGGPGSGKTTIATRLAADHPALLVLVPEAATQVYRQLNTRWNKLDADGRRDLQRRIFLLQNEQEHRFRRLHPAAILLLDRATIDGAAYWPDGPDDYWRRFSTSLAEQSARYDAVIWLQSTAAGGHYDPVGSNAVRTEDAPAAVELGRRVERLWSAHPRFRRIGIYPSVDEKLAVVKAVLNEWGLPLNTAP
jgi:predicted ATPase